MIFVEMKNVSCDFVSVICMFLIYAGLSSKAHGFRLKFDEKNTHDVSTRYNFFSLTTSSSASSCIYKYNVFVW